MTRDTKPISHNVCFVNGKIGDYYIKSDTDNPNGVPGYGDPESEKNSYSFLRRHLPQSMKVKVPRTHMIGRALVVSAAPGIQISSYVESGMYERRIVQIFIQNFLDSVLRTSLDPSQINITGYLNQVIDQLHNRISVFRSNQGNVVDPLLLLLSKLESYGYILIRKLESLAQRNDVSIRLVVSHGDLNPENIFVNPECGTVYLIDPRDSTYRDVAYDLNTFLGYFFVFCGSTRISETSTGLQIINPIASEIISAIDFLLSKLTKEEILLLEVYLYLNFSRIILGMYNSRKRYIPTEHGEDLAWLACVVAGEGLEGLRNSMQMKES